MATLRIEPVRFEVEDDLVLTPEKEKEVDAFKIKYAWLAHCNLLLIEKGMDADGPFFLTIRKDEEMFNPEEHEVFRAKTPEAKAAYSTVLLADGKFPDGASAGTAPQPWAEEFIHDLLALFDGEYPLTAALDVSHPTGERNRYTWTAKMNKKGAVKIMWEVDED